jgi:hypothetical protein
MVSMALCGSLASRDAHPRDDRQVRCHTLGFRADRGGCVGEPDGGGRRGGDPACFVRSFTPLPGAFLEDRRVELVTDR